MSHAWILHRYCTLVVSQPCAAPIKIFFARIETFPEQLFTCQISESTLEIMIEYIEYIDY